MWIRLLTLFALLLAPIAGQAATAVINEDSSIQVTCGNAFTDVDGTTAVTPAAVAISADWTTQTAANAWSATYPQSALITTITSQCATPPCLVRTIPYTYTRLTDRGPDKRGMRLTCSWKWTDSSSVEQSGKSWVDIEVRRSTSDVLHAWPTPTP